MPSPTPAESSIGVQVLDVSASALVPDLEAVSLVLEEPTQPDAVPGMLHFLKTSEIACYTLTLMFEYVLSGSSRTAAIDLDAMESPDMVRTEPIPLGEEQMASENPLPRSVVHESAHVMDPGPSAPGTASLGTYLFLLIYPFLLTCVL